MHQKHTLNELNTLSRDELITIILTMQGQLSFFDEADMLYDATAGGLRYSID